jgi:tol-pal system protein YbgF
VRVKSARAREIRGHGRSRRWLDTAVAVAVVLVTGLSGGCGRGAKPAAETKAPPPDSPAALRQEVDRLGADLAEIRTRVEASQRAGTEHADRVAQETRAEFDAVQKAIEASSRHDLQRQVEVLDAQARRIDLLERRATELGQALRRVELSLGGIESQLARVLDPASTPAPGARGGSPARSPAASPAPRPAEESTPPASTSDSAAAGAGLTPPAMLGPSRRPRSSVPPAAGAPAPPRETKVDSTGARAADAPPAAKKTDAPRATPPARPAPDDAARVAKAAPPPVEPKAAAPERPAGGAPPRPSKTGTAAAATVPAPGSSTARALFDRAMENWNKGEQGQAVVELEELVQTFPSDPLAASAQFRIGEAYYAARDFERASLEYRKAVDLAPKGKDTPQALLRLGLAYRAQKRESDARQAWSQLVRDFPESDATEEARRALRGR